MSEKRFIVESVMITNDCNEDKSRIVKVITDKEELYSYEDLYEISDFLNEQQSIINRQSEQHKQILNELINENSELRMKIVSLENEVQRQNNELKNTRKEFIKKTEELNWLKSEDYLKKIY